MNTITTKYGETMWEDRDPRTDEQLELVRDDDIVRRAQLWATGATIHDVNGLIGLYQVAVAALDCDNGSKMSKNRRYALETMACAYGSLEHFMSHGDYRKARKANPLPRDDRQ